MDIQAYSDDTVNTAGIRSKAIDVPIGNCNWNAGNFSINAVSVRQLVLDNGSVAGVKSSNGPAAPLFLLDGQGFWFNIVVKQTQSDNIVSRGDSSGA